MRLVAALPLALALGALTGLGFAPVGWWWATLIGFGGLTLLLRDVGPRRGLALGYLFGLGYFGITVWWVGNMGWYLALALVAFLALWGGLSGWVTAWILTRLPRLTHLWPLVAAIAWTSGEWCAARLPFGGFCWSRFAYTVPDQPLGGWLPVIGAAGVSFLVALTGALLASLVVGPTRRRRLVSAVVITVLMVAGGLLRLWPLPASMGTVRVGVVQGNTDISAGPLSIGAARTVTAMHLGETISGLATWRADGDAAPDMLLWPENASDMDPSQDAITNALISQASNLAGVPMLVGVISMGPGPNERQTTALWWQPEVGPVARLDKHNLAPFGEFVPLYGFFTKFVPMTREVGLQSVPGTGPRVMHVDLDDGTPLTVGNVICYELAYDSTVYSTVDNGAQLITVQSSNESMSGTTQPAQQFAMTRVRAMEMRREIVVATTQSLSGLIDAHGHVLDVTTEGQPAFRLYDVELGSGVTPGVLIGQGLEDGIAGLAALMVLAGAVAAVRKRHVHPETVELNQPNQGDQS
ncbi:MAG: apolipoprotein N-acyltransferase [Propionibacteriaceae bacterium]|nr:apolipoprotein N-acyltransferase [Propionibacteriaceae bacterium]